MKKALCITMVAALAGLSFAQEQSKPKSYFAVGYQGGSYSEDSFIEDVDLNGGFISYGSKFHDYFGAELKLGVVAGSLDMDNAFGSGIDISSDWTGVDLDLVIKPQYAIEDFSIYGILGVSMLFVNIEVSGTDGSDSASTSDTDTEFGLVLGAGAAYDFGKVGIFGEISTYQYSDYELTPLYSIGARYNF